MIYGLIFVFSCYIIIFGFFLSFFSYIYTRNKLFQEGFTGFLRGIEVALSDTNSVLDKFGDVLNRLKIEPGKFLLIIYHILNTIIIFLKKITGDVYTTVEDIKNEGLEIGNKAIDAITNLF